MRSASWRATASRICSCRFPVALAASALSPLSRARSRCGRKGVYFIMITLAFGQMLFFLATSLAAYGGDDGMTLVVAQPRRGNCPARKRCRPSTGSASLCLLGAYVFCPRDRRLAVRPGPARHTGEHAFAWKPSASQPFRYQLAAYVHQRHDGGACRMPARQPERVRQPGLHDLAALRRTDLHGGARRARLAAWRHHRAPPPSCCWRNSCRKSCMAYGFMLPEDMPRASGGELEDGVRPPADPDRAVCAGRHHGPAAAARIMAEPLLELRNLRKALRRARRHRRRQPRRSTPASCTPSSAPTAPARRR